MTYPWKLDQLHLRFVKFLHKALHSSNTCTRICTEVALRGSHSSTFNSVNYIYNRYDIDMISQVPEYHWWWAKLHYSFGYLWFPDLPWLFPHKHYWFFQSECYHFILVLLLIPFAYVPSVSSYFQFHFSISSCMYTTLCVNKDIIIICLAPCKCLLDL